MKASGLDGSMPLHWASKTGHIEVVRLLLEKGADVNDILTTPLYWASTNGHVEVVRLLLKKGADVNAASQDGLTPLYKASIGRHIEMVKMLAAVQEGTDIAAADRQVNDIK